MIALNINFSNNLRPGQYSAQYSACVQFTEYSASVSVLQAEPTVKEEKLSWSILREDFMLGAEMKDWDKAGEGGDESGDEDGDWEDSDGDTQHCVINITCTVLTWPVLSLSCMYFVNYQAP